MKKDFAIKAVKELRNAGAQARVELRTVDQEYGFTVIFREGKKSKVHLCFDANDIDRIFKEYNKIPKKEIKKEVPSK